MALLFCDGFDAYSAIADASNKWDAVVNAAYSATAGRYGGGVLQNSSSQYQFGATKNVSIAIGTTFYVAFSVRIVSTSSGGLSSSGQLVKAIPGGTTPCLLGVNAAGQLCLQGFTNSSILATGPNVVDAQWHWVECSFNINGSTSSSTCYVDGIQAWTGTTYAFTGVTGGIAVSALGVGGPYSFGTTVGLTAFDDVIFWDNTGSTFNTFPLGLRRIGTLVPNGAGASTQFTPSSGTNWAAVAQAYSGTAYVQDSTGGKTDLYATPGLSYTPSSVINAAVVNTFALNPSGSGANGLTAKLRSGSTPTVASGVTRTLGSTAANRQDVFVADALGTAWTATTINAAQPGIGD